jgi:hypothetical protein
MKTGKRQLYTKGETLHKIIQKLRIHKTENEQRRKQTSWDRKILKV